MNEKRQQILIRRATEEDAPAVAEVHFAAVHQTAAKDYPADILDQWSPLITEARIQQFRGAITSDKEWMVVALLDSQVVGFGSIVPSEGELRAVYVRPDFGGRGIGRRILHVLEEHAIHLGLKRLRMDGSLTAEAFYRSAGYQVVERGFHRMRTGNNMACVKMTKELVQSS